ncbi:hypothetical protein HZS_858, partial [Henneguya salminicola]
MFQKENKTNGFLDFVANFFKKTELLSKLLLLLIIVNEILGSGFAAIPYAVDNVGPLVGFIILIVTAFFSEFNIRVIVELAYLTNTTSYKEIIKKTMGPIWAYIINTFHLLIPILSMILILIIIVTISLGLLITQNIYDASDYWFPSSKILTNQVFITPIMMSVVLFILVVLQDTTKISLISCTALIFVFSSFIIIFINTSIVNSNRILYVNSLKPNSSAISLSFSITAFALACHHNIVPIYSEYRHKSLNWFMKMRLNLANFFDEYCINETSSALSRTFNAFSLIVTAVTQVISIKDSILELTFFKKYSENFSLKYFMIMIICSASGVLSTILTKADFAIDIVTIISLSPCVYIFYPIALMCGFWKRMSKYSKFMCILSIFFGGSLMISGVFNTLYRQRVEIHEDIPHYWCEEAL